jgi:hypothetical protein
VFSELISLPVASQTSLPAVIIFSDNYNTITLVCNKKGVAEAQRFKSVLTSRLISVSFSVRRRLSVCQLELVSVITLQRHSRPSSPSVILLSPPPAHPKQCLLIYKHNHLENSNENTLQSNQTPGSSREDGTRLVGGEIIPTVQKTGCSLKFSQTPSLDVMSDIKPRRKP